MTNASLPVPEGFVLLSSEFNAFIDYNEIKSDIDAILHNVNKEEMHTVEDASEKIQAIITNSTMRDETKQKILEEFEKLEQIKKSFNEEYKTFSKTYKEKLIQIMGLLGKYNECVKLIIR